MIPSVRSQLLLGNTAKGGGLSLSTEIGTYIEGGYYAGPYMMPDGKVYGLIVAEKSGELDTPFGLYNAVIDISSSPSDGFANTAAMTNTEPRRLQYLAATYCLNYRGGGFSDWYMPSTYELMNCYYYLKPTTTNNFATGGNGSNPRGFPTARPAYTTSNPGITPATLFKNTSAQAFNHGSNVFNMTSTHIWSGESTIQAIRFTNGQLISLHETTTGSVVRPIRKVLLKV